MQEMCCPADLSLVHERGMSHMEMRSKHRTMTPKRSHVRPRSDANPRGLQGEILPSPCHQFPR